MIHDLKARILQVLKISTHKPGSTPIQVTDELRYTSGVGINNDFTLVPKWYIDTATISPIYFTDNDNAAIDVDLVTGIITISDMLTNFPVISGSGIIRGYFDIKKGSDWFPVDQFPEITKDIDGNILTAAFYLNDSFDSIRGRIF